MEGRKQINLPADVCEIIDHFSAKYAPPGVPLLTYPQTIQAMAAALEPGKFNKKK